MPTNEHPLPPSEELESSEQPAEAPFAGFESDPGLETAPAAEGAESGEEGEEEQAPEPIVYRELSASELQAAVEATFFLHHKPVSIARLRELINPEIPEEEYRTAVSDLMAIYFDESRGIELTEAAGGYQFRTKSEFKDILRRMYQIAPMKLTNAMLEVLAIVAYNQPITREVVDKIRGVDSSHLLRVLLDKKMLRIVGKSDEIGRPMIYGTSKEFLELFGLRDLSALPSLREIEDMLPKNEVGAEISEEEALAKEMEGIVDASKPLEFNDLELEEDLNETQKVEPPQQDVPALAHGNGSEESHGSSETGSETNGDLDLPAEALGRLPVGPEGNA
jgi:segregation and condensation protein B